MTLRFHLNPIRMAIIKSINEVGSHHHQMPTPNLLGRLLADKW
jgi:hypothetical protein